MTEPNPWKKRPTNDGPPNLDELLSDMMKQFNQLTGGNGSSSQSRAVSLLLIAAVAFWAMSGWYIIPPESRGVLLRFGEYQETQQPGLHWRMRGIEQLQVVDVSSVERLNYESEMLTRDESYAKVAITVFYKRSDPVDYLYNNEDPEDSLRYATASALRSVIGTSTLEDVITSGKDVIREQVSELIHQIVSPYKLGIVITDIKLQQAKPPVEVIAAFDDATKAREDEQKLINQGDEYRRRVLPAAHAEATRIIQEGQAYHRQVTLNAEAEVAKFSAILDQHTKNPAIIESTLYYQALDEFLPKTRKAVVSQQQAQQLNLLSLNPINP